MIPCTRGIRPVRRFTIIAADRSVSLLAGCEADAVRHGARMIGRTAQHCTVIEG